MRLYTPTNKDGLHGHNALSWALEWLGSKFFMATVPIRPATVTIYNVATTDALWTAVAVGLTGVLSWKLTERSGRAYDYCFDGVGATYVTSYGSLQRDTEITAVYIRRRDATDINAQLEIWTT